jgi:hypothetical protein
MESPALADQPASAPSGPQPPAEREARWVVWARFLIEADSEAAARAIAGGVFAQMEAKAADEPEVVPFSRRPGAWVATAHMDLTVLPSLEPDDARTRLSYLSAGLGEVTWTSRVSDQAGRWDWPPDIWSRGPADDLLVSPAVLAATLSASAETARTKPGQP